MGGPEPSPGPGEDRLSDRGRLRKAPTAFRTISEVADELHVPQHVLRFWETRFGQVSPLKRGGGRRYYRPDDVTLLRRIADLLYVQGYTIKGVQRLLAEGGSLEGDLPPPELVDADLSHPASGGDADAPQSGLAAMVAGADPGDTTEPVASSDGTDRLAAEGTLRRTLAETLAALEDIRRTLAV